MVNNMIIYTTADGLTKVETTFDQETVWLTKDQMAELFQRDRSVISRHIQKVFAEGELDKKSNVQKMHVPYSDKYKARTFSEVEQDYLDSICLLEEKAKRKKPR